MIKTDFNKTRKLLRKAVYGSVSDSALGSAWGSVWVSVRDSVWDSNRLSVEKSIVSYVGYFVLKNRLRIQGD